MPSSIISRGPFGQSKLTTGTPKLIASITTNPKGSALLLNTNMDDFLYSTSIFVVGPTKYITSSKLYFLTFCIKSHVHPPPTIRKDQFG